MRNLNVQLVPEGLLQCRMSSDLEEQTRTVELNRTEALCVTQFPVGSADAVFRLALLLPRIYSPDVLVGMRAA